MPQINRFRIVNFRYDDDKKYISNELYEFDTKNSLINLENGGGKSVILQLALQVVLPNTSMGTRNFSNYFKVGASPTHILVEWKLDGTRGEYLLTGICVSKNADGIRFFTYTHTYTLPYHLDIKAIEVVNKDKQVANFSEYYNYLKRMSSEMRLNINTYSRDRQREYRDKIHTFNLFKEEFEAIKTINQSEGGIDKFFENARKSRNVIEKLIIPNIPTTEGESEGILAQTFKKHLENLKNIPLYQHSIKTYEAFCNKANSLLLKLEDYGVSVEEINNTSRDILALENLISIAVNKLYKDGESLKEMNNEYLQKIEELLYKKDSLFYQNKIIDMEKLKSRHEEIKREVLKTQNDILNYDKKIKFIESNFAYNEMIEQRNHLSNLMAKLETKTKERSEIDKEYQNCLYYAKELLNDDLSKLKINKESLEEKKEQHIKEKENLIKKLEEINTQRDSIRDVLSSINTRIIDLKDGHSKITRYFAKDVTLLIGADEGVEKLSKEKESLENEIKKMTDEIEKTKKQIEDVDITKSRIKEALAVAAEKKNNIEKDILLYNEKCSKLNNEISMYEVLGDIYSNEAHEALKAKKIKIDNSASNVLGKYHELLKRKYLFEGCDYYIPDIELKKVYELLNEKDIRCIPGSLWLKNQEDHLRGELLHQNPLLCHSIVIQKGQLQMINDISSEILELVENFPVTFIVDSQDGISTKGKSNEMTGGIDRLGDMEAYVVFSQNNVFSLKPDKFKDYLISLDEKIDKTKEQYEIMKKDVEKITGLLERCFEFKELYPINYLSENQNSLNSIQDDIAKKEADLKGLEEKRQCFNELIDKNINDVACANKLIEEKEKDIEMLKEFVKITGKLEKLNRQLKEEEQKKRNIEEERTLIDKELQELLKKIEILKDNLKDNKRDIEDRSKLFDEISLKLDIKEPTEKINGTLDYILSRAKGLEREIEDSAVEEIRKSIDKCKKDAEKLLNQIHLNGFTEEDFEETKESFTYDDLENSKKELYGLKTKYEKIDGEERKLSLEIAVLEGKTEELQIGIQKRFNLEPYTFEYIENVNEKTFNDGIEAYNRKKQKNIKKLEEVEKRKGKLVEYKNRLEDYINENEIVIKTSSRENMDSVLHNEQTISMWDMIQLPVENIAVIANDYRKKYKELIKNLNNFEISINESYDNLYREADWAENITIRMILEKIIKNDMYNYSFVKELFKDMLQSVENMKNATSFQLEESLRDKDEIVERCYAKAEAVYDELKSVDGFSKIKFEGTSRKTVIIEMPALHKEEGKALMTRYIEASISEIEKMKEEGKYDPARIDGEIAKIMSPVRLLDAVTSLNEYSIKVFKPESTVGASRYIPWEVVVSWSGGEKLAGFFAMFISIISYLRYKKTGWKESSKVIWIDNPFGQANANYLLSYIFDLARATNTQMICLTGHMQVDIYMQFDVVYSLIHRVLTGMNMSVIQSKLVKSHDGLESAFYKVQQEQMSLF
ncbi:UNVERIFIED_CONTAM: chromosome segregation ATPase [Acetivibrio alkalicellulosi]